MTKKEIIKNASESLNILCNSSTFYNGLEAMEIIKNQDNIICLVNLAKDSISKYTLRKLLEEKEEIYKNTDWGHSPNWLPFKIEIDLLKQLLEEE